MNTKPLPDLNDLDTGFFWQGTARDTIHVKRCADCGRDHWPPRLGCPYCGAVSDIASYRLRMPSLEELRSRFSAAVMARHIEKAYFGALGIDPSSESGARHLR